MNEELKPCPFCGCKDIRPNVYRQTTGHGETDLTVSLYCHNCPCCLMCYDSEYKGLTEQMALLGLHKIWNKRHE